MTRCPTTACDYPNSPADSVLSAVSNQHSESIADPQPDSGWIELSDLSGGEIGDKCNFDYSNTVENPQTES